MENFNIYIALVSNSRKCGKEPPLLVYCNDLQYLLGLLETFVFYGCKQLSSLITAKQADLLSFAPIASNHISIEWVTLPAFVAIMDTVVSLVANASH